MFTGLIEEVGHIVKYSSSRGGLDLRIEAKIVTEDINSDDSIAVNGVCLTASSCDPSGFEATIVPETVKRTTFRFCSRGDQVNLERAVRIGDRMGGHWVQGHVDGTGRIVSLKSAGKGKILAIRVPMHLAGYIVEKGSIALHGVSLTVVSVHANIVSVALIPVTLTKTILGTLKEGEEINIETDLLAKYIEKQFNLGFGRPRTESELRAMGYET